MANEIRNQIRKTYTIDQLLKMTPEAIQKLIADAGDMVEFHGTGVVRKQDGSIRYDADAVPGNFGESPEDMKAQEATE